MKYSIIVPVYNVQDYLRECLDSIVFQTFTDFELIIVNDGSTDNSLAICEEYSKKYQNIVLISQENKGLGGARNTGIQHAKGEWLIFIDSDDYVDRDLLRKVNNEISENSVHNIQMIVFDWDIVDEQGFFQKRDYHYGLDEGTYSTEEFIKNQIKHLNYYWTIAWQGIYKTGLFKDGQNRFASGIYHEDDLWFPQILLSVASVFYLKSSLYKYRQSKNSTMRSNNKNRKHLEDIIFVYGYLYNYIESQKYLSKSLAKLMKKDISKWYLSAIFCWKAYEYKDLCLKIEKTKILKNSFAMDKVRAVILLLSDRLYFLSMKMLKKLHINRSKLSQ